MQKAVDEWPFWSYRDVVDDDKTDKGTLTPSPVLRHLSINNLYTEFLKDGNVYPTDWVVFLRSPTRKDVLWTTDDLIDVHNIAARSFACIPPVAIMRLRVLDRTVTAFNPEGVTVIDVLDALRAM